MSKEKQEPIEADEMIQLLEAASYAIDNGVEDEGDRAGLLMAIDIALINLKRKAA